MKAAYVDTSCLVCVAFAEPGRESTAQRLASYDRLFAAGLVEAELRAVFAREGVSRGPTRLLAPLAWVRPDRRLSAEMERVLDAGYVRGADLWHLAVALFLSPSPEELAFLTLDRRQEEIAQRLGFA